MNTIVVKHHHIDSIYERCVSKFPKYLEQTGLSFKQYQQDGIEWALRREVSRRVDHTHTFSPYSQIAGFADRQMTGGILADEMGLGKTMLAIGLIYCNVMCRTLIVVPVVLLDQWKDTIEKYLNVPVLMYHGVMRTDVSLETIEKYRVVLTTYGTMSSKHTSHLHTIHWGRVIYDEAHRMRNPKSRALQQGILLHSDVKWLITGTPINNKLQDFYTLMSIFGIQKEFCKDNETCRDIKDAFILKRTRKQVDIRIPELQVHTECVRWTSKSEERIATNLHNIIHRKQNELSTDEFNPFDLHGHLIWHLRARQMCIHHSLLGYTMQNLKDNALVSETEFQSLTSSKFNAFVQCISNRTRLFPQDKRIVFCSFRNEMSIIKKMLSKVETDIGVIDGRLTTKERFDVIHSLPNILMLQIQTCCEGLNLQEYNEIYFVGPTWNPAVEDQAIARCHRQGQTKQVNVFHFIMENLHNLEYTQSIPIQNIIEKYTLPEDVMRHIMSFVTKEVPQLISSDRKIRNTLYTKRQISRTMFGE
tara:strand:+ start:683 stop:2275 length:1593 start_codon:yes stop_codon:yes gene_type:complete